MSDWLDELLERSRCGKPQRPEPEICLHKSGIRMCYRTWRSFSRGRIGLAEAKRRYRVNYQRTGAYMGPVGWCDDE